MKTTKAWHAPLLREIDEPAEPLWYWLCGEPLLVKDWCERILKAFYSPKVQEGLQLRSSLYDRLKKYSSE